MFNNLANNNVFYILDKTQKPILKIGKVKKVDTDPQYFGLANHSIDITIDVDGDIYEFKKIPANVSIISPSKNIIISDNAEDLAKEYESITIHSQQILDNIEYHQSIVDSKDEILSKLNPKFAKEKEQENKLNSLENRVGNMEQGIDDIKTMLAKVLNK